MKKGITMLNKKTRRKRIRMKNAENNEDKDRRERNYGKGNMKKGTRKQRCEGR